MRSSLLTVTVLLLVISASLASAQQNSSVPDSVVDSWSYLIGDWTVEGHAGTQSIKGTASFEWAADKSCYFGKQVWQVGPSGRTAHLALLGGWDAAAHQTVEQGFSSFGSVATLRYAPPAEGEDSIEGTIEGADAPGAPFSGTVKYQLSGPDEFQLSTTINGQPVHSLKYVRNKAAP